MDRYLLRKDAVVHAYVMLLPPQAFEVLGVLGFSAWGLGARLEIFDCSVSRVQGFRSDAGPSLRQSPKSLPAVILHG